MTPAENVVELVSLVKIVDELGWALSREQLVWGLAKGPTPMTEAEVHTALDTAVEAGEVVAFDDNGTTLYSITEYLG
jgi:hypothetical protein